MSTAYQSAQYTVSDTVVTLAEFSFTEQELLRMELATIYTKADILITYDGENSPEDSPEYGIYLASGTLFSLDGRENLNNLEMIRAGAEDSLVTVTLEYGE
jgi:hypothetical protein